MGALGRKNKELAQHASTQQTLQGNEQRCTSETKDQGGEAGSLTTPLPSNRNIGEGGLAHIGEGYCSGLNKGPPQNVHPQCPEPVNTSCHMAQGI